MKEQNSFNGDQSFKILSQFLKTKTVDDRLPLGLVGFVGMSLSFKGHPGGVRGQTLARGETIECWDKRSLENNYEHWN